MTTPPPTSDATSPAIAGGEAAIDIDAELAKLAATGGGDRFNGNQGEKLRGDIINRVRYTHEALIDFIVANPTAKLPVVAAQFGLHPVTVRRLMTSDIFREKLAERRLELVDPAIMARLEDHFEAVALRSLEVLQEKLALPASMVSESLALKAAELGAKALSVGGFSSKPSAPTAPPADRLDSLAARLVGFLGPRAHIPPADVVDVASRPLPSGVR